MESRNVSNNDSDFSFFSLIPEPSNPSKIVVSQELRMKNAETYAGANVQPSGC